MTEVLMKKEMGGLRPDSDDAYRILGKIRTGAQVVADIRVPGRRSSDQHRFWFALANLLFESQDYFKDFETYRKCLLVKLGHCDVFRFKDGTAVPIARSLKFGKMPQDEFNELVEQTLAFAESVGFDRDELLAQTRERMAA